MLKLPPGELRREFGWRLRSASRRPSLGLSAYAPARNAKARDNAGADAHSGVGGGRTQFDRGSTRENPFFVQADGR